MMILSFQTDRSWQTVKSADPDLDGCEWRSEAFVKIHFFFIFWGGGGLGSVGGRVGRGQGGWEQRSEACVKNI